MRRRSVLAGLALVALLVASGMQSWAQGADVKPTTVTLKVDDKSVLATCQGLKVRITNSKDDFIGHSYFISHADLKVLAKKRGLPCVYDAKKKTLTLGKETKAVIPPDPKGTDSFAFGKVRQVSYQGKIYFDVQGLWSGLGFDSCSKMSYGFTMAVRKK